MNGALDVLIALAAAALSALLAFRAGVWWSRRCRQTYKLTWRRRMRGAAAAFRPPLPRRLERFEVSSPSADGVPGDNPAGVSIPPTTVPPAGVRLRLIDGSSVTVSSEVAARIAGAADFFPQYRGRS